MLVCKIGDLGGIGLQGLQCILQGDCKEALGNLEKSVLYMCM